MHVAVVGAMGVGKSTLMRRFADLIGAKPHYEMVADNPFLARAYTDPTRWALPSQMAFLHQAAAQQAQIAREGGINLQDATLDSHLHVYIATLHERGALDDVAIEVLTYFHGELSRGASRPQVHIHLRGTLDCVVSRIAGRDREIERTVDPTYVEGLQRSLDAWLPTLPASSVIEVDADTFNVFDDAQVMELWARVERTAAKLATRQ